MANNLPTPIVIGLGILLIATVIAPILLPHLLGVDAKRCECGVRLTSNGISPYCKCKY